MPLRSRHGIPLPTRAAAPFPAICGDSPPPLPDLEILVAVHGRRLPRAAAIARTFAHWHETHAPMPRVLCAWCYGDDPPGDLATLPDYPWLCRVPLPEYDIDDGVFRKEGLLNLLLYRHATAPYLLALDADVWTPRRGWFAAVRDALAENPARVFQPWATFQDTAEHIVRRSWSARSLPGVETRACRHPGLGWAFSRAWAEAHGGQPVFCGWQICGAGDGVFVSEHFASADPDYLAPERLPRTMRACVRTGLPRGLPHCLDVDVWHQNHTDHAAVPRPWRGRNYADRGYTYGRTMLDRWGDVRQYVHLDSDGVPMLVDPSGPFAKAIARKPEMQSRETTDRVLAQSLGLAPAAAAAPAGQLPEGDPAILETLDGIGDHLMLCGVVRALHRERPHIHIAVHLSRPDLAPWFREACPTVEITPRHGRKLAWLWDAAPPGRHYVESAGAKPQDIRLAPPRCVPHDSPRIAFVGAHNPVLPLKTWPHWARLAELVRERYGVEPIRVGVDVFATPASELPALLGSMDLVVCTEGAASHVCWAIRRRAVVLLTGAINASALAYPGWHTVLQGACPHGRHCHRYTDGRGTGPDCAAECMAGLRPETVLEAMQRRPRVVNVHFLSRNCGDANCGVARYFPGIEERGTDQPAVPCDVAIFGGGGLYQERVLTVARRYRDLGARIVIWGAGIVTEDRARGMTPYTWREFGDMADICALREPSPWEFAPCPSCLSPLFDELRHTEPEHDVVYYNHPDKPARPGEPRMTNYDTTDFETVLRFLASGRRVVTSSYHGRIWSTWLGRAVELDGPAAPMLAQSGEIPPLEEARRITRAMHARVLSLPGLAHARPEETP